MGIRKHSVILLLTDLSDRLLENHAHSVDDNINLTKVLLHILEKLGHGRGGGQITLVKGNLNRGVLLLEFAFQFCGAFFAASGVVVEGEVSADAGKLEGGLGAKVLDTASDESNLSGESHDGVSWELEIDDRSTTS